jgi:hypothetical protein
MKPGASVAIEMIEQVRPDVAGLIRRMDDRIKYLEKSIKDIDYYIEEARSNIGHASVEIYRLKE